MHLIDKLLNFDINLSSFFSIIGLSNSNSLLNEKIELNSFNCFSFFSILPFNI